MTAERSPLSAAELLEALWRQLRNDCGVVSVAFAHGALLFAALSGAITEEQRELWLRRFQTCPGHDDEGGRVWCAYCGNMPTEEAP